MIAIIIYLTGVILTFITCILIQTRYDKQHVYLDDIITYSTMSIFSYAILVIILFIFILNNIKLKYHSPIFRAKE